MPVKYHNQEKVRRLLEKNHITEPEEVERALEIDEKIERWKSFIDENVLSSKRSAFT
jgi:hypothetical protein